MNLVVTIPTVRSENGLKRQKRSLCGECLHSPQREFLQMGMEERDYLISSDSRSASMTSSAVMPPSAVYQTAGCAR